MIINALADSYDEGINSEEIEKHIHDITGCLYRVIKEALERWRAEGNVPRVSEAREDPRNEEK